MCLLLSVVLPGYGMVMVATGGTILDITGITTAGDLTDTAMELLVEETAATTMQSIRPTTTASATAMEMLAAS